jgi:ABC-type nitrate/sulfonate/bicarbonate transport system substrate-binding protein
MHIRVKTKPTGIPAAEITAAPAVTDAGASQVKVFVSSLDEHSLLTTLAVMTLSTKEARDLAARILNAVHKAEDFALANLARKP